MNYKPTVFFGPFIGEFGWELLYWQGWVRKMCQGYFKHYQKIAASFPGREPFYPDVDQFIAHPSKFLYKTISSRDYRTDNWQINLASQYKHSDLMIGEELVQKLLCHYKKEINDEKTKFIVPTQWNCFHEFNLEFGVWYPADAENDDQIITKKIPFSQQYLDYLYPTNRGIFECAKIVEPSQPILAVFPRERVYRNPDINWPKESYEWLIRRLQKEYPEYKIGIFSEPGGAYFVDEIPEGCLDFINTDPVVRTDIQVAALKQTKLAIGSISGAIFFALACGAPSLTWGFPESEKHYYSENFMKSPFHFITNILPSVDWVFSKVQWMMKT